MILKKRHGLLGEGQDISRLSLTDVLFAKDFTWDILPRHKGLPLHSEEIRKRGIEKMEKVAKTRQEVESGEYKYVDLDAIEKTRSANYDFYRNLGIASRPFVIAAFGMGFLCSCSIMILTRLLAP